MYLRWNVRREVLFLLLYTIVCNLALITAGAATGYSSVVLPVLTSNTSSITLTAMEAPLFASIISINQIIGCVLSCITMNYGRRCTMIVCSVNLILGWILIASSYNVAQLFVGRSLTGIATGLCLSSIEIYLAEICISSWKETIIVTPNTANSIGVLIVYFVGFVFENNWRLIAAIFIAPSILLVLCNIFFIHESPEWLLMRGRKEEAKIALLHIRGLHQETIEFQEEFAKMTNYVELINNFEISRNSQLDSSVTKDAKKRSFLNWNVLIYKLKSIKKTILLPEVWKPFVILNFYFFFQQFSGLMVILNYAIDIISMLKITGDPFLITVILGIVQVLGQVMTACCSIRIGRRIISIVSGVGVSISLGTLSVYLELFEDTGVTTVPLVCILLYMIKEAENRICVSL
ncbi:PREDICTED: sugar transporter ERD6-like 9 isoform X2 [Wasmannia auropunctata]|uniref:sugar transporter ERD6-like 9 isoform X2 n=1 Tax=Wasmannia auropunctata TaxID=64793 RepID=UPI0005EE0FA3|nr:PREDICTED: sugar transporter ERD6-like 9 isoform X2 [Wasmannia auropunctata]